MGGGVVKSFLLFQNGFLQVAPLHGAMAVPCWSDRLGLGLHSLRCVFTDWIAGPTKGLERAAALKDVLALMKAAPRKSMASQVSQKVSVGPLDQLSHSLHGFLRDEAVPLLRKHLNDANGCISPYAGGLGQRWLISF